MYVSLHNRSAYSFGSSLLRVGALAEFARAERMPAIALTDLHGLYGAVAFQQACRKAGVKPIFGAEFHLADGVGVTLLAQTLHGYGQLCRLISTRHLRDAPLERADVFEHATDLICLLGRTPEGLSLEPLIAAWRAAFADRLSVALAIHHADDVPIARRRARAADACGVPVAATCEARCQLPEEGDALRALASIGTLTLLDQPHPDKPVGRWHLRPVQEMRRLFARRPDALERTLHIAEQCNVELDLSQNRFPAFESPDGRSAVEHLRERCRAGCRRRYQEKPPYRGLGGVTPTWEQVTARLERELSIIGQVQYAEYFLVFDEIVQYCNRRGIATLARGSAADSLVCYALGVSKACPFRFDLPFDRFINPERAKFSKMADIDLDLPWDQRDEVIRWVYDRWGMDRVAMIGTANTFHARAAVGDLGKVHGLPPHEVHKATRFLPSRAWGLPESVQVVPEAREVPIQEEPYRTILRMAEALEGLPRHWSMHPCGIVISPAPLTDLVPVERSSKGPLVAQYDMDAIEDLGFIKIDLLGQAGLSVLRDAVAEVKRTEDVSVDLEYGVDYSEPETWDLIASGHARGVHHIESPAMTSLLVQSNCRDIDCLTTIVALIRPGAANQGKKEVFCRRHQGYAPAEFVHPSVRPVLEGTYGLMVFEEHILQIAVEFAGMNVGRADVLRRGLNKGNPALIAEMRMEFIRDAHAKGRSVDEIVTVWKLVEGFAGFMFNKAHSAEYALEAFQGAWLKRRWPAHYIASILSNYRGFYAHSPTMPQILYVLEAMRLGAGFLLPCVNRSRERFSVERGTGDGGEADASLRPMIRIPISHIKGLSQRFVDRYLAQRQAGAFESCCDFLERCRPDPSDAILLLDSGALDLWSDSRPELFWRVHRWLRGQAVAGGNLWAQMSRDDRESPPIALTPPDPRAQAAREMELLGFPVSIDPLAHLSRDDKGREICWEAYVPIAELPRHAGRRVQVCGLMVADRVNDTMQRELMKFVTLGDRTGFVETILFPQVYQRFGHLTATHPILAATGVVEPFENGRGLTLRVLAVMPPRMREPLKTSQESDVLRYQRAHTPETHRGV